MTEPQTENSVIEIDDSSPLANMRRMIQVLGVTATNDGESSQTDLDFQLSIAEKILSGETEEEIFAAQEAGGISGQNYIDTPFMLHESGIEFRRSTILSENVFPFYAMMTVTNVTTGEEDRLTCGGLSVVAVLYALRDKGFLTEDGGKKLILKGTQTAKGFTRLSLLPVAAPKKRGK